MSITRETILTASHWTLEAITDSDDTYYQIKADGKRLIHIDLSENLNFKTRSIEYTVSVTPTSKELDLDEAAEFAQLALHASGAARAFQAELNNRTAQ